MRELLLKRLHPRGRWLFYVLNGDHFHVLIIFALAPHLFFCEVHVIIVLQEDSLQLISTRPFDVDRLFHPGVSLMAPKYFTTFTKRRGGRVLEEGMGMICQ